MSIERQFSKGVAWMAAGNWIEQAVNLAVFIALARMLGDEAFGHAAMAVTFVVLAEALVRETVSERLISDEELDPEEVNRVFWLLVYGSGALAAILALGAYPISLFYGEPIVFPVLGSLSVSVILVALAAVPVAILRRALNFRILSLRAIAGVVAGGVVGVLLALNGAGVWALVAQHLTLVIVNTVMAVTAVDWRPSRPPSLARLRQGLDFGSKMFGLRLGELLTAQSPIIIIGWAFGPALLGQFSLAWRVADIAAFLISTPIRYASQPAFAAMTRSGGDAGRLLTDIARIAAIIAAPAFVGLAMTADLVVGIAFGEGWELAGMLLPWLCVISFYLCVERVQQSFALATGDVGGLTRIAWGEAALGLVLILAAALVSDANHGLFAVAVAMILRSYAIWPLRFQLVERLGGPAPLPFIRQFAGPLLGAAAMAACVWLVRGWFADSWAVTEFGVAVAAGGIVFALMVALFMRDVVPTAERLIRA